MVYDTQNGPTLTSIITANTLKRGDQIVHPAKRGTHKALVIAAHPTHDVAKGVIRVKLTYPDGAKYGHGVFARNAPVPYVIGGRTRG